MSARVLCVRLDNAGDVLLTGPAIRAVAAGGARVTVLAGPNGAAAAGLLPGVAEVITWRCPWIDPWPPAVDPADVDALVARLAAGRYDAALVFTSFHQSALPTAMLLRLAGVPYLGAVSEDYPGSLLDLRHQVADDDQPEAERALSLAVAAGHRLPDDDDGALRVRRPLPDVRELTGPGPYVVLHPGTSVPARAWPVHRFAAAARALHAAGRRVVVTGGPAETELTRAVAGNGAATDLGGRTSLAELAAVLAGADVLVVGNTGPAHLAAATATPVVSLFAPTVPASRWAPYRVPRVVLGNQRAPCRGSRVTKCSVPGHPCLMPVTADDVVRAVAQLTRDFEPAAERVT
ncbi:glycosyltransferase family 9 protein [Jiangella asiatica]|uniref:Glycosyltransferase family 9 protein n=1 Tax=Jiangella asiatica TaxID=2530372 RepID=A0A4R5DGY2_9ACTN|nr:glycosyltransferase family 9 protein [Jiangella asiatica]TDE09713.1 glycosyltransferase family 9 protein [Jiangella asiatica]